jgi:lipoate-protein ligase A
MTTWKLLDTSPNHGAYNMAMDEELLARAQREKTMPVLRFYGWDPPTVSLGRFQNLETAINTSACEQHGIAIVRRITGGRAVLHHQELSYCIVARNDDPLFPPSVLGTYKTIAACLVTGLRSIGIPAETVARTNRHTTLVQKHSKNASCFSSASWYELLVHQRKILGSAQRRLSCAFLQHGSLLLDYDPVLEATIIQGCCNNDAVTSLKRELGRRLPSDEIKRALCDGFSKELGVRFID